MSIRMKKERRIFCALYMGLAACSVLAADKIGSQTRYTYDEAGRRLSKEVDGEMVPEERVVRDGAGRIIAREVNDKPVSKERVVRDGAGRIISREVNGGVAPAGIVKSVGVLQPTADSASMSKVSILGTMLQVIPDDRNSGTNMVFGGGLAVDGNTLVVTRCSDKEGRKFRGITVLNYNGRTWQPSARLDLDTNRDPASYAWLGLRNGLLAVIDNRGILYICTGDKTGWKLATTVNIAKGRADFSPFKISVAVDNQTIAIGMPTRSGYVMIYEYRNGQCIETAVIQPDDRQGNGNSFGNAVALSGDDLVVGDSFGAGAHVYRRSANVWKLQTTLQGEPKSNDGFGHSVAFHGSRVVVGTGKSASAIYVFERKGLEWVRQSKLSFDIFSSPNFSEYVAGSRSVIAAGCRTDESAVAVFKPGPQGRWQVDYIKPVYATGCPQAIMPLAVTDTHLFFGAMAWPPVPANFNPNEISAPHLIIYPLK
jgi:hypothetical protein